MQDAGYHQKEIESKNNMKERKTHTRNGKVKTHRLSMQIWVSTNASFRHDPVLEKKH